MDMKFRNWYEYAVENGKTELADSELTLCMILATAENNARDNGTKRHVEWNGKYGADSN
jgi:hypothetical protein